METTVERLARLYHNGRLSQEALRNAVPSLITEEQYQDIIYGKI